MGKKTERRRSCSHCRTRKIACSGEQICARCKTRGSECVYDLEGSKGRPRSNVPSNFTRPRANEYPINWNTPLQESSENEQREREGDDESESPRCVAVELDIIYREHFGGEAPRKKDNLFQKRIASFNRALLADKGSQTVGSGSSVTSSSSGQATGADGATNYHGFLTLVTLDLIETIVLKFSRLGVHAFFGSSERYYQACMLQDTTTAMFDEPISPSPTVDIGPLAEYSSHLLAQLVDVWFTHHPMCILLSKSLLLSDSHTNSAKPVMVAIPLADAYEFIKDAHARKQADRLLNWAINQLQFFKPVAPDLTIAQTIFMMGLRQICWGQVRRTVCCVAYAGRITTQLKHQIHHAPILEQTHINGVD
ncbi:hypothetical protein N7493_002552 [Penicillium malachiteum]|uniref:Zn(2)-C6 fungal-type domain-containing protein n=1 Tax=Penicillium malachiteum TaxID=1324776 RepID=A0AAD6MYT4_9EURO|nr:hypothetical protein N7493_002552 [Penicillium malachiteum]